uniref:Tpr-related protein family member, putative n=1 Tax=Theileria annulata TaxID=5874 RepID=A0A3B0NB20_THEAN
MGEFGKDELKISAFTFAGLAMMLNIRLVYSAAPYALLRFKLPENLFSVFVRVMASSLELWCLPSMTIANIMDYFRSIKGKDWKAWSYHYQSIFWSWCNFLTFVILWISFIIGGDQGNVTTFYWVIAASGFVFGINMVMVYAMEFQYLAWYMIGENSFPMVTSLMHYVGTLFFGNRRKWNSDYIIVTIDIIISLGISLVAAILWTYAYYEGKDDGYPPSDANQRVCKTLTVSGTSDLTYTLQQDYFADNHATKPGACGHKKSVGYYAHFIPPSLMVLIGMGLVYCIYPGIAPGMIVPFYLIDKIEMVLLIATAFPPVIIGIMKNYDINPYIAMGNWGTYHKKACKGGKDPVSGGGTTEKCDCQESGGTGLSNLNLKVHNTTITATGGLNAIATIKVTKSVGGSDHEGPIETITDAKITATSTNVMSAGRLKTTTNLVLGDILTLTGKGAIAAGEVQINGTIIVTKAGTLGETITLNGRLVGKLTLTNVDGSGNKHVNVTARTGLNASTLSTLKGINVSGLRGTATMEITSDTDDLTKLTNEVTITVSKLTKGTVKSLEAGGELTNKTSLETNDTLILVGTASAGGINGQLKVNGTITIGGDGNLSSPLEFIGDVSGSLTDLQDAPDGGVTVSGTLNLQADKLTALQNTNFSLISDTKRALTYSLVTKSRISIGTNTTTTGKVTISGLTLIPACTTISATTGGFKADISDVTISETSVTGLKEPGGLPINLNNLNNANVEITKDNVKSIGGESKLETDTTLNPGDTLNLNITTQSGGGATISGTIRVTSPGTLSNNLTLKGGIETTISGLSDSSGSGTLTSSSTVNISNLKYDHMEFHVNHQATHCCFWGGKVFKWSNTNPKNEPWHIPVVLGPFQICLAAALIYSLHYTESNLSRSIVNQPKMSTALSIIFYMCHEIQLALGFPGIASDPNILLPMQLVGAFLMVLLAFYSVGYITEYKRNDPLNWPTDGMTTWNSLCYWLKMASKITNKNFKQLFTTDLRRDSKFKYIVYD